MPASHSAGFEQGDNLGIFTDPTETYTHTAFLRAKPTRGREDHLQGAKGVDSMILFQCSWGRQGSESYICVPMVGDVGADWRKGVLRSS